MSAKSSSRMFYAGFFTFFNIIFVCASIGGSLFVKTSWNNMSLLVPVCLIVPIIINSVLVANIVPKAFVDTEGAARLRKMALFAPIITVIAFAIGIIIVSIS